MKDKPIFYRQFSDKEINTNCEEDRWSQARHKYKLLNKDLMKLPGLIESIPGDWKSVIKNDSNDFNRTYSTSNYMKR